jgi:nucleoside-diphosphate-sugar epimerase
MYGVSKHALHLMLEAISKESALSSAWGRIFYLYGPHEHPDRLVPSVVCSLLRGELARSTEGEQLRDYLHVEDVADALVTLLLSDVRGAVNIASGFPIAVRDIILRIADILDRKDLIRLGALPTRAGEPRLLLADVSRLFQEVGWRPQRDMDEGLRQTIEWWKAELFKPIMSKES